MKPLRKVDEPVRIEPVKRQIIHGYGEKISQEVFVAYNLLDALPEGGLENVYSCKK